ncbi:neurosecretory protein VGF [Lepisosteus oculatus]|uniref:neurosecretory protein VGF n=1 Tax=Lepisosteus oculatus TaxID=7918 RepID=UPI0037237C2E
MIPCQHTLSAPLLLLLLGTSLAWTDAAPGAEEKYGATSVSRPLPPAVGVAQTAQKESREQGDGQTQGLKKEARSAPEPEDELFKDVDPKTLAAVLLEALNQQEGANQEAGEGAGKGETAREALRGSSEEGRREEAESQLIWGKEGLEERERDQEEEERKRAEEEERLTERVKSRTRSQEGLGVESKSQEAGGAGRGGEREEGEERVRGGGQEEQEEQLSPQEVENLQAMLEELQSYSTTTKRERDSLNVVERGVGKPKLWKDRTGGYKASLDSEANEVLQELGAYERVMGAMNKGKTQQNKIDVELGGDTKRGKQSYMGQNFFEDSNQGVDDEEEEEILSPEEEEARARAEQEEVRRQAAEAQRAKEEEEKLADIASDLLLQYLVKQDGAEHRKQQKQQKQQEEVLNSLAGARGKKLPVVSSNAAEDKRSDEDDDDDDDDDDIDPQTIDKLIEISSKLHLPADDVVDIINDVEKKKKKDAPEPRPRKLPPPPRSNSPPPLPAPQKPRQKDKFLPKQAARVWQKQTFSSYPSYSPYQKPFRSYYPFYYPPPKPRFRNQELSVNDILGNSLDYDLDPRPWRYQLKPKPKPKPWSRPQPSALFISNYIRPRTYLPPPPPRRALPPARRRPYYYSKPIPLMPRDEDYYDPGQESEEELENFIEKVFLKRPRMF